MSIRDLIGPNGEHPSLSPQSKILLDANFNGSLPPGVSISSGTATHADLSASIGYVQVATTATTDSQAIIRTSDTYTIGYWDVLWCLWEGVRWCGSGHVMNINARFNGASSVFGLNQQYSDGAAGARILRYGSSIIGPGDDVNLDFTFGSGRAGKLHQILIGIDVKRKVGIYAAGSDLVTIALPDIIDQANVRPELSVTTKENASHWVRCSRMKVWGEYS